MLSGWPNKMVFPQYNDPCCELHVICYDYDHTHARNFGRMNELLSWIMELSYEIYTQGEESVAAWQEHGGKFTNCIPYEHEYNLQGLLPLGIRVMVL